ncbi:MAG: hypothetical protein ACYC09_00220 [Bacteroidota bacterium]
MDKGLTRINAYIPKLMLFIYLMISISFSQDDQTQSSETGFKNYIQIGFVNEAALYYHHPITESFFLKSGANIYWGYEENKDDDGSYRRQESSTGPTELKLKFNRISSSYDINFSSLLMYNINGNEYAKFYLGIGPSVLFTLQKSSSISSEYTDSTFSNHGDESLKTGLGIGPAISIMIVSHVYRSVSIVAEYNVESYYTWTDDTYSSYNEYKYANSLNPTFYNYQYRNESNGWKFRLSRVKVGLLIGL